MKKRKNVLKNAVVILYRYTPALKKIILAPLY